MNYVAPKAETVELDAVAVILASYSCPNEVSGHCPEDE